MATSSAKSQETKSKESVYAKMTSLAQKHGAVNLGQGFPEDEPDHELKLWACEALMEGPNQYAPPRGTPELRRAISLVTQNRYDVKVDSEREVLVSAGAEAALSAAFLAFVNPGDEIVLFSPYYLHFKDKAAMVGAALKLVPIEPSAPLDLGALERACSSKTKMVILNSPSNPLGRVFSREEISAIIRIVEKTDAFILFDDAYEFFIYDGRTHACGLSFESIRERAICVSSLGKTLCATGWRLGYAMAEPCIIDKMAAVHLQMVYCVPPNLQKACAKALKRPASFFSERSGTFMRRRDLLCDGLAELEIPCERPQGGFFATLAAKDLGAQDDVALAERLIAEAKLATVPLSPCFEAPKPEHHRIRLCFAKSESTIRQGLSHLKNWLAS